MVRSIHKINIIFIITLLIGAVAVLQNGSSVNADTENVDFNVNVTEALTVSISKPTSWASGDADNLLRNKITVSALTNNNSGVTVSMYAADTNLQNTTSYSSTDATTYIPTLDATTYTYNTFPSNAWGYSLEDSVAGTASASYLPMTDDTTAPIAVLNSTLGSQGSQDVYFGAKASTAKKAGTYAQTVYFTAVTIPTPAPVIPTMQDFTVADANAMSEGDTTTLKDSRDDQNYTVAKINNNVWMTRNLAIGCNGSGSTYGSSVSSKSLTSSDSNVSSTWSTSTNLLSNASVDTETADYSAGRMQCDSTYGAWYNYYAATAGTISGSSNETNATKDICPTGWRLPTEAEFDGITSSATAFSPVAGGYYYSGSLYYTSEGLWWSATSSDVEGRYSLRYNGSSLNTGYLMRYVGHYVRCIKDTSASASPSFTPSASTPASTNSLASTTSRNTNTRRTANSTTDDTTTQVTKGDTTSSYVRAAGVTSTTPTTTTTDNVSTLGIALASAAGVAAVSGIAFLVAAKRRKDDD